MAFIFIIIYILILLIVVYVIVKWVKRFLDLKEEQNDLLRELISKIDKKVL